MARRTAALLLPLVLLAGCGSGDTPGDAVRTAAQSGSSAQAAASPQRVAADYDPLIQQIYLAYFGRPADPAGLSYYAGQYLAAGAPVELGEASRAYGSNPGLRALIDSFSNSQESQDLYGGDNAAFINAIYRNLFSRDADAAGRDYWADLINRKLVTRANAAVSIMAGAQQSDLTVIANKSTFAQLFTGKLVTEEERQRYSGLAANAVVRRELLKITATTDPLAVLNLVETARGGIGILPPVSTGGRIASMSEGYILDAPGNSAINFVATSTGLYMQVSRMDSETEVVAKLQGAPGMLNSWSSAEFDHVSSWAVASRDNDPANAMSFYWVGYPKNDPDKRMYGLYTINTGLPSSETEDDIWIDAVAAGGNSGIATPRPWVIANGPNNHNHDYQYVFQQAARQSASRLTSNLFSSPADKQPRQFNDRIMLSHPDDPKLFVGDGNVLRIYSSEALEESIALPDEPFVGIHTLLWAGDSLWIGYGNKIYRRTSNGALSLFTTIDSPLPPMLMSTGNTFCVQGGYVYMMNGMRKNIFMGTVSDWLSGGTLTQDQQLKVTLMRATMSWIACHPNVIWSIYSGALDGKIRHIQPLP